MSTAQASKTDTLYEPGRSVDHYKVLRLIGRGGMGEVYLARDTRLGRKVALKVVRPDAMATPDARERFLFEARTTARFNHPHIVTIHDVGEHDGRPYVALEHLEGQSLRERLQTEKPGPGEALRIGRAIAEALAEAHTHQIVHRDLKPGNVLLGEDGRLRVLDFGLARALTSQPLEMDDSTAATDDETVDITETFETDGVGLRGTPAYMAPEQWRQQEVGPAADIWALGIILCQTAYGAYPFSAANPMALRSAVLTPEAVTLPETSADISAPLEALIRECVAKVAEDRPTAERVAERLAAMMQGERRPRSRQASPFRGLLPFDERHGDHFFGRDDEIAAFVERLRTEPVLPVVGPSGAGKSSFVQAGVMPRLREQGRWLLLRLRPGTHPLRNLAQRFVRGDTTAYLTGSRLATGSTPHTKDAGAPSPVSATGPVDTPPAELGLDETVAAGADTNLDTDDTVMADSGAVPDTPSTVTPQEPAQGAAPEDIEAALRESPSRLALLLASLAEQEQARVLLFVDQLEELYTLVDSEQERAAFMEAVASASDDPESPVRVVFTLRDDFLGRLAAGDAARRALSRVTVLRSPGVEALREILVRPLEAVGYRYEDDSLVDEMVREVRGEAAALPLMQFAGQELWEHRDRKRKLLTRETYEAVGGVAGALAHHADGVLDGLSAGQVISARQLLVRLVTSAGTRQVVSRAALLDGLDDGATEVLDRLIEARTVLRRKARSGEATETVCELVHESLIVGWDRLRRWVEESREERAFLAEANQAADLWLKRGRRDAEVWEGDALREAGRALAHLSGGVPEIVREFITAGQARQRRVIRRRRLAIAAVFGALALVAVVLAFQKGEVTRQRNQARTEQHRAETQKHRAEASLKKARRNWAEALREGAGAALVRKNYPEARARLRASLELHDSPLARTLWLRLRGRSVYWKREALEGACKALFTPDGRHLVACAENNKAIYFIGVDTRRVVRILRSPKGMLKGFALSADGKRLAAGARDGAVWLWDLSGGAPAKLTGHAEPISALDFSPDSRWLATGSRDRTVRLWKVSTRKMHRVLRGHRAMVMDVKFHPRSHQLATGASLADKTVKLWDVSTGKELRTFKGHTSAIASLAWSPDGKQLASGAYDRTIRLWNPLSGKTQRVLRAHKAAVLSLAYSPDGKRLASGGNGDNGRLWNPATGRVTRTLAGHSGGLRGVQFHPTRPLLATKTISVVRLFDLSVSSAQRSAADNDEDEYFTAALTPSFSHLVQYSERGKGLKLRNLKSHRETPIHTGHTKALISMVMSRDGKTVASGANDNTVRLWSVPSGKLRRVLVGGQPYGLGFSRQGDQLITFSVAKPLAELWSHANPGRPKVLRGHGGPVRSFAFRRDGKRLATGAFDGSIRLWQTDTGRFLRALQGHKGIVWELIFSPRGDVLYSCGQDRKIRFWNMNTGRMTREIAQHRHGVHQMLLSEDGRRLVTRSRKALWLWDTTTGKGRQLGRLTASQFLDIAIHPRGEVVAASLANGTVRIWRVDRSEERTLRGHSSAVTTLSFRRDGDQLATIAQNGSIQLWDVATLRPVLRAPLLHHATRELYTHQGWLSLDAAVKRPAVERRWRRVLERRGRQADETSDGAWLCVRTFDDRLQLWDLRADRRIFTRTVASMVDVQAVPRGCLVRIRKGPALLFDHAGKQRQLLPKAKAIGVGAKDRELLAATDSEAAVFDLTGARTSRVPLNGHITALAAQGSSVLLGRVGGSITVSARTGKGADKSTGGRSPIFQNTPASPVVRLLAGPLGTVIAGYSNGEVGMWNVHTGRRLYRLRLLGPVAHLTMAHGNLYVATALGDHRTLPISALHLSYCELLHRVWRQIPIVWLNGRPVRRPPPAHHRCRAPSGRHSKPLGAKPRPAQSRP